VFDDLEIVLLKLVGDSATPLRLRFQRDLLTVFVPLNAEINSRHERM
jgi:hypothetical protein